MFMTALLCLKGANLRTDVSIPFTKYRPASTNVSFRIEGPDLSVGLTLPKWNTRSLYSRPHWYSEVGNIGLLHVDVSYCYHTEVHLENVDQLRVDISVSNCYSTALTVLTRFIVGKECGIQDVRLDDPAFHDHAEQLLWRIHSLLDAI